MKDQTRIDVLEIDSRTGKVALNGKNLERVNLLDIHMEAGEMANVTINMDVDEDAVILQMKGKVQWFKKADRECGQ